MPPKLKITQPVTSATKKKKAAQTTQRPSSILTGEGASPLPGGLGASFFTVMPLPGEPPQQRTGQPPAPTGLPKVTQPSALPKLTSPPGQDAPMVGLPQPPSALPKPPPEAKIEKPPAPPQTAEGPHGRDARRRVADPLTKGFELEFANVGLQGEKKLANATVLAASGRADGETFPMVKLEVEGGNRGFPSLEMISGPLTVTQEVDFWLAVSVFKRAVSGRDKVQLGPLIRAYNELLPRRSAFRMTCKPEHEELVFQRSPSEPAPQTNMAVDFEDLGRSGVLDRSEYFVAGKMMGLEQFQAAQKGAEALFGGAPTTRSGPSSVPPAPPEPGRTEAFLAQSIRERDRLIGEIMRCSDRPEQRRQLQRQLFWMGKTIAALTPGGKALPPGPPPEGEPAPQGPHQDQYDQAKARHQGQLKRFKAMQSGREKLSKGQEIDLPAIQRDEYEQLVELQHLERLDLARQPLIPPVLARQPLTPALRSLFTAMFYQIAVQGQCQLVAKPRGGGKQSADKQKFSTYFKFSLADALLYILTPEERAALRGMVGYRPGEIDGRIKKELGTQGKRQQFLEYAVDVALATLRHNLTRLETTDEPAAALRPTLLHDIPRRETAITPYAGPDEQRSYVVMELRHLSLNENLKTKIKKLPMGAPVALPPPMAFGKGRPQSSSKPPETALTPSKQAAQGIAPQQQMWADAAQIRERDYANDPRIELNNQLVDAITGALGLPFATLRQLALIRAQTGTAIGFPLAPNNTALQVITEVLGITTGIAIHLSGQVNAVGSNGASGGLTLEWDRTNDRYRPLGAPAAAPWTAGQPDALTHIAFGAGENPILDELEARQRDEPAPNDCLIMAIAETMGHAPTARQIARIRVLAGAAIGEMLSFGPRTVNAVLTVLGLDGYAVEVTGGGLDDRVAGTNGAVIKITYDIGIRHFMPGCLESEWAAPAPDQTDAGAEKTRPLTKPLLKQAHKKQGGK